MFVKDSQRGGRLADGDKFLGPLFQQIQSVYSFFFHYSSDALGKCRVCVRVVDAP